MALSTDPSAAPPAVASVGWQGGVVVERVVYDAIGGEAAFRRLVDAFYDRVTADAVLRPLYPEEDLGPARDRLRLFLEQYWGGPTTYSDTRGHPRLRMRHATFPVGTEQIAAWLRCMRGALDEVALDPEHDARLWGYFLHAASFLRNQEA